MTGKYTVNIEIASYMADYCKRLRPDSFMSLAQEMAMKAATNFGFGYDQMGVHRTTWVLSRLHVVFLKTPLWRENMKMITWHKGLEGLLFLRDFDFRGENDEELIKATSSWLVMDTVERRLVRPDKMADIIPAEGQSSDNAIEEPSPKLMIPRNETVEQVGSHIVQYSDLDFLGHVNNTKYMNWALDCISEIAIEKSMKEFYINFNQECKMGEEVQLFRWDDPDGAIYIEGKAEGRQVFITKLIFNS